MSRLVVTGAAGLLGAPLVLRARDRGHDVTALVRRHPIELAGVRTVNADLATDDLDDLFAESGAELVVHCAALTDVDRCEARPEEAERENALATRRLAAAAASTGAALFYVSTDYVFDGERGGYTETDPAGPVNVYGRTKLQGERAVREELPLGRWLIARTAIYGWNARDKKSLAEFFLSRLEAGQPVAGFKDAVFTPILVDDLAEALLDLAAVGAEGTFHVGGSEAVTKLEFGRRVASVFGHDPHAVTPVVRSSVPLKAPRPRDVSLLTAKVEAVLGRPMPGVDRGLERMRALRASGAAARLRAMAPA